MVFTPFRPLQISCFLLSNSLRCFPSVPNYCSNVGISPLLQFLHLPGGWFSPTHSCPLFPFLPLSYQVLLGSMYSFPVFRALGPLSAVVSLRFFASEEVFLMIPVEKFSPTDSSSILLNHLLVVLIAKTAVSHEGSFVHILSFIDTFLLSDCIFPRGFKHPHSDKFPIVISILDFCESQNFIYS